MGTLHPLENYRNNNGLSRAKLARQLEVSVPTLFRWEKRERQPDPAKLADITKITGIPAKDLRPDLVEKLGADR